jgi:glycerophosphoryl diester phosphodiesterase
MVYGGDEPIEALRQHLPDVRTTSRAALKACLLGYMATGWTGVVPASCGNRLVLVPINVAPWLWGWPGRFVDRMEKAGSKVFLLGPYSGGDFSKGIDSPADFDRVPADYAGGIYTNEIEAAASVYKSNAAELDE